MKKKESILNQLAREAKNRLVSAHRGGAVEGLYFFISLFFLLQ